MFSNQFDYRIYQKVGRNDAEFIENLDQLQEDFKINLRNVLEEIFDKSKPFVQTNDEDNCKYCSYSSICHRDVNI